MIGIGKSTYKSPIILEEWEPEMLDLDYLPEPNVKPYPEMFTPEIDEALLKYWPKKQKCELAKALGVTEKMLRRRFRDLTSK